MMIDAQLWAAYCEPYFQFSDEMTSDFFAVITAWNPASQRVSNEENLRNNQRLALEISHTNYVDVLVGDEAFTWKEASFAVAIERELAIELGRKFGQNAIYYVENNQLYLLSCLPDATSLSIKGWQSRIR